MGETAKGEKYGLMNKWNGKLKGKVKRGNNTQPKYLFLSHFNQNAINSQNEPFTPTH